MTSIHHRGSLSEPGLVLALDAVDQAQCKGIAMRVAEGEVYDTIDYLRERELVSSAYIEQVVSLELDEGDQVTALAYVIDVDHEQYVRDMPLEKQAQIISYARGGRGANCDYLFNTVEQLHIMGIHDPDLTWLAARVREIRAESD